MNRWAPPSISLVYFLDGFRTAFIVKVEMHHTHDVIRTPPPRPPPPVFFLSVTIFTAAVQGEPDCVLIPLFFGGDVCVICDATRKHTPQIARQPIRALGFSRLPGALIAWLHIESSEPSLKKTSFGGLRLLKTPSLWHPLRDGNHKVCSGVTGINNKELTMNLSIGGIRLRGHPRAQSRRRPDTRLVKAVHGIKNPLTDSAARARLLQDLLSFPLPIQLLQEKKLDLAPPKKKKRLLQNS